MVGMVVPPWGDAIHPVRHGGGADARDPGLVSRGGEGGEEESVPAESRPTSSVDCNGVVFRDAQGRAESLSVEALHTKGAFE